MDSVAENQVDEVPMERCVCICGLFSDIFCLYSLVAICQNKPQTHLEFWKGFFHLFFLGGRGILESFVPACTIHLFQKQNGKCR